MLLLLLFRKLCAPKVSKCPARKKISSKDAKPRSKSKTVFHFLPTSFCLSEALVFLFSKRFWCETLPIRRIEIFFFFFFFFFFFLNLIHAIRRMERVNADVKQSLLGGTSSCAAVFFSNPFDTAKTRLM
jgi:hypothetical protein